VVEKKFLNALWQEGRRTPKKTPLTWGSCRREGIGGERGVKIIFHKTPRKGEDNKFRKVLALQRKMSHESSGEKLASLPGQRPIRAFRFGGKVRGNSLLKGEIPRSGGGKAIR